MKFWSKSTEEGPQDQKASEHRLPTSSDAFATLQKKRKKNTVVLPLTAIIIVNVVFVVMDVAVAVSSLMPSPSSLYRSQSVSQSVGQSVSQLVSQLVVWSLGRSFGR